MDHTVKKWLVLFFLLISYAVPANATTYYWGAANKTLSAATDEVTAGYYGATTLHSVDSGLAAGNIKSGTTVFGILGTLSSGTTYGLPKTGQQPGYPTGTPFATYDDAWYAAPTQDATVEIGYPRKTGSWTAYNTARFTANGDGTVTDNATGLMWVKDPSLCGGGTYPNTWGAALNTPATMKWAGAITNCEALTYATYTDWRMPNINELLSIVNYGRADNQSSYAIFTNQLQSFYWSSTTRSDTTPNAWGVYFTGGSTANVAKTNDFYVRPVRGGQ